MDRTNNFVTEFRQWVMSLDEDYLVGIANRGLFNRARKDLGENPSLTVHIGEDQVRCTLPDGTTCTLTADIQKFKCSCPSRGICKHILMGLLYLRQNWPGSVPEEDGPSAGTRAGTSGGIKNMAGPEEGGSDRNSRAETPGAINLAAPEEGAGGRTAGYSALLNLTPRELRRLGGEKAYADCVLRLKYGIGAELAEGTMLVVRFAEENITVRFPPQEPLNNSVCTCKASGLCRHRIEAVLHYQLSKGVVAREDLIPEKEGEPEIPAKILGDIQQLLEEILALGLSRLPANVLESLEQTAVICHGSDLPGLEKQLRGLHGELQLYFGKMAAFSREKARRRLSVLYAALLALQSQGGKGARSLAGEHRSAYFDIPTLEISGMGAEGWRSKSGYAGLTFYFYSPKLNRWLTYTNTRPTYYDGPDVSVAKLYKSSPPWNVEGTAAEFSKSKIQLVNGKLNGQGRLSAGEQATGTILHLTRPEEPELSGRIFRDWTILLNKLAPGFAFSLGEKEENFNLVLLQPSKWGAGSFNALDQIFTWPVFDEEEKELDITVGFQEGTGNLIKRLEKLAGTGRYPELLLARVYIKDNLKAYPISVFFPDGRIVNLSLEEV